MFTASSTPKGGMPNELGRFEGAAGTLTSGVNPQSGGDAVCQ